MKLLVVESPARLTLQKHLDNDFEVLASFGHFGIYQEVE